MTSLIKPPTYDDAAYEQIAAAVMETERGRWFLAEYARRNRQADTETLLDAINKLSRSLNTRPVLIGSDVLHRQILDMARAILRAEKEIRAMHARDGRGIQFAAASETLDTVVETTEKATSAILSTAERVQEQAWTLRELGVDPGVCDELDRSATEIYTACGFQDLTAQRIAKAVETLKFLDARIRSLVEAAGLADGARHLDERSEPGGDRRNLRFLRPGRTCRANHGRRRTARNGRHHAQERDAGQGCARTGSGSPSCPASQ